MDIIELSKCEDIFYNILPHLNNSLLTLKGVSTYFNTYINNYINNYTKNKHHILDLTKYDLHNIPSNTIINRAKTYFMIKYYKGKEKDNILIIFLLNHIILNMIKHLNHVDYGDLDDFFPSQEIIPKIQMFNMIENDIKNNYDLLENIYAKSDGIIKLTYLLKSATLLEMAYMKDNELVNYCKTIHTYIKNKTIEENDYDKIKSKTFPTHIYNALITGIHNQIKILRKYNYAIYPGNYQPSGTINMSHINRDGDFNIPTYITLTLPTFNDI